MDEYNIGKAFAAIEDELMASMIRNMKRHRIEEVAEHKEWTMWQAEQLKALELYKKQNRKKYGEQFENINRQISRSLIEANQHGSMEQEIEILEAIRNGFKGYHKVGSTIQAEFFVLNERKLDALIKATTDDMKKAETAVLRMANDRYRKVIYNAQVYANTGAGTYEQAVDMATKDFLAAGLNCVEYANGARHTIEDYADMAIRTASKRAYLQGEGMKRQEWGVHTVIMNRRGNPCPKCLPFVGKILIDDVWSGGKPGDGPYPLMSAAIRAGLYHPRCKDSHTTYFEGISSPGDTYTKAELAKIEDDYRKDQKQQYAKHQAEKFGRLAKYSLDEDNKKKYALKAAEWNDKLGETNGKINILKAHSDFIDKLRSDIRPSLHKDKMVMYSEYADIIEDGNLKAPFSYDPILDVIKYNPKAPHIEDYDMDYVFAHEISHRMDELEYHSWKNEKFLQAIEICQRKVYDNKEQIQKWFESGGKYEESFALSDIIGALSNGGIEVPVGHKKSYWDIDEKLKPMEIFADISSIDVLKINENEAVLKELFEAYEELIK